MMIAIVRLYLWLLFEVHLFAAVVAAADLLLRWRRFEEWVARSPHVGPPRNVGFTAKRALIAAPWYLVLRAADWWKGLPPAKEDGALR